MNVLMGGLSQVKRVPWMASGIYIASSGGCKCEVWLSGDWIYSEKEGIKERRKRHLEATLF